jgi:hypothetical protein
MRLMMGIVLLLTGCTKATPPLLQLEMYGDNQASLYIVEQSGSIAFGGGRDALSGVTTWKGWLTEPQLNKLQRLLHTELLHTSITNKTNRYEITVFNEEGREKHILPLTNAPATELYHFLEESTLSRFQSHLDALPKPSMDIISQRAIRGASE